MSTDPKKPMAGDPAYESATSLLIAVMLRDRDEIRKLIAAKADPNVRVMFTGHPKLISSAYQELVDRIWWKHENGGADFKKDAAILEEILTTTRIPILTKDCPWLLYTCAERNNARHSDTNNGGVLFAWYRLQSLAAATTAYRHVKDFASNDAQSSLLSEGRICFAENRKTDINLDHSKIIRHCGDLLYDSPSLFHELIEDRSVWASSLDAAYYAQAAAALVHPNHSMRPPLSWVNRMLEEDQKDTPLAKYARDETPAPGGKR